MICAQEELLNKQNQNIRDYEELITKNKKNFEGDRASASTYARKILYNKKDLNFYNISLNILKFILLFISIAIIYLLMKGNKLKRMTVEDLRGFMRDGFRDVWFCFLMNMGFCTHSRFGYRSFALINHH